MHSCLRTLGKIVLVFLILSNLSQCQAQQNDDDGPDIEIIDISYPDNATQYRPFLIMITVRNNNGTDVKNATIRLTLGGVGNTAEINISEIPANGLKAYTHSWVPRNDTTPGTYRIIGSTTDGQKFFGKNFILKRGNNPILWIDFQRNRRGEVKEYIAENVREGEKVLLNITLMVGNIGNRRISDVNLKLSDKKSRILVNTSFDELIPGEILELHFPLKFKSGSSDRLVGRVSGNFSGEIIDAVTPEPARVDVDLQQGDLCLGIGFLASLCLIILIPLTTFGFVYYSRMFDKGRGTILRFQGVFLILCLSLFVSSGYFMTQGRDLSYLIGSNDGVMILIITLFGVWILSLITRIEQHRRDLFRKRSVMVTLVILILLFSALAFMTFNLSLTDYIEPDHFEVVYLIESSCVPTALIGLPIYFVLCVDDSIKYEEYQMAIGYRGIPKQ